MIDPDVDPYTVVVMNGEVFIRSVDIVNAIRRTAESIAVEAPKYGVATGTAADIAALFTSEADALEVLALDALVED